MKLKTSILLALVGISYIFISRTLATFIPELFMQSGMSQVNVILSVLAVLAYLFFYIQMYRLYALPGKSSIQKTPGRLRNAVVTGMISVLLVLPVFIKGIFTVYGIRAWIIFNPQPALELILLLASALGALYFIIVFYDETLKKISASCSAAAKLAISGASVTLLLRTYLFFNYYYSSQFRWSGDLSKDMPYIIIPLLLFVFYTSINFLWAFYREQRN